MIKMKIEYIKSGDYFIPDLEVKKEDIEINYYGRMRLEYLKNINRLKYEILFLDSKLEKHLAEVSKKAVEYYERVFNEFVKNDCDLTEELKERNQLLWVGKMNYYKNISRELTLKEIVYLEE